VTTPRTAEQLRWSETGAKRSGAMWGCWDCGFEESYVRDTDKDAEHVRVRRRQCTRCGAMWETEERRIARGSFFGRAERRRYAHFRKSRYAIRTCLMCKERYQASKYREHTAASEAHRVVVERRLERKRRRERVYQREWMRVKRALQREQAA
jgi:predicted  nucleic acid-binding Zn-ribbon protein